MRAAEVAFVGALVHRFRVFLPILQEHLDDYDALLPHVLMGDLTRWVVSEFETHGESGLLREVLDFIESSYSHGDDHEQEPIAVSFLENLPRPDENASKLRALLGPSLSKQLRVIG
ncbi:MAG: hypothetical protein WEE36_02890 [Acidimicrobiia bacterium]